jgi:hypothetical protein
MKICKDPDTGTIPYGMYPLILITEDGITICQDCANKSEQECFNEGDIYYEGPDIECDECGQMIQSAYGDPDELP